MKSTTLNRLTLPVALLAVSTFCPNLQAGWGSLQGSNHSAPRQAPAARPAPVQRSEPVPRAEPARPAVRPEAPIQERPAARPNEGVVRQQPGFVNESRPEARPAYHTPAQEVDRRRMDIDGNRRQTYSWSDYHRGMRIDHLPDGYRHIGVHGHDFFYWGGVFYDNGPSGYVVVAPPIDADISDLPPGAETVQGPADNIYYYVDGAFYVQEGDGYVVVAPPMSVTVSYLPSDAVATQINGTTYYQADGAWYQPVFENGVTAYLTVPQPG